MFSYYGSKKSIIHLYPPPRYNKIIEPFAGAASYSMQYPNKDILLIEKYKPVFDIWNWLINKATISDILNLPTELSPDDNLDNINFEYEEAKILMGFIIAKGVERPRVKPTKRATILRPNHIKFTIQKIIKYLPLIKKWEIILDDYKNINNQVATWFIDPPYYIGGNVYPEHDIDYNHLSNWCQERKGQIIVCENSKADWLPFKKITDMNGSIHKTEEVIWTNLDTNIGIEQLKLF